MLGEWAQAGYLDWKGGRRELEREGREAKGECACVEDVVG